MEDKKFIPDGQNHGRRKFGGRGMINIQWQCVCCRDLTSLRIKKPGILTPVYTTRKCNTCLSESDLILEKLRDGRLRIKQSECRPTEEGMKHYYMHHPEKDPENVQPDGENDSNNFVEEEKADGDSSPGGECLPGETDGSKS